MVKLGEILDEGVLLRLIDEGYISAQAHRTFPLTILNYTHTAQYDPKLEWGREMNLSRGLIFNHHNGDIIARPFAKFWNFGDTRHPETLEENLPNEVPFISDKMDGSLGILYHWDGENYVATRGSFYSDQALWATAWLHAKYPALQLPKLHTICSEIIFNSNKIVIDYDFEGLIILGAINNETGIELPRNILESYCRANELSLVQKFSKSLSDCLKENITNREGYVLTYRSTGLKVKVKFEDYVRLHKILTGLNVHSIWELLRDSKVDEIQTWMLDLKMSAEFKVWLNDCVTELKLQFSNILTKAEEIFDARPINVTRKELAEYFLQPDHKIYSSLLFSMADGKEIASGIWKRIEPVGGIKSFKKEDE